jgi:putative transposase
MMHTLWTNSHCLSTVGGAPLSAIQQYIENPKYTSQICSGCGAVAKKELGERWHSCSCGCELDRDMNAAINILRLGRSHQA